MNIVAGIIKSHRSCGQDLFCQEIIAIPPRVAMSCDCETIKYGGANSMNRELNKIINQSHKSARVVTKSLDNHIVSNMIGNQRFEREYLYYSKMDSLKKFKEDFLEEYTLEADGLADEDWQD